MNSGQEGGDGYTKFRKTCQTGGASGWAKHCGNTDDHQRSNRLERRAAKQDLNSGQSGGNKLKRRRDKKNRPTRKHLMDLLAAVDKEIKWEVDWVKKFPPRELTAEDYKGPGIPWDSAKYHREHMANLKKKRDEILGDFEKYGREKP